MILPDEVLLVFLLPLAVQVVLVLPHLLPHLVHLEDGHDHDDNGDGDGDDDDGDDDGGGDGDGDGDDDDGGVGEEED